ncbi:MAG: hypothetical protein AB7O96_06035 [Pseudobdellovibrionaceae bacterium]
MKSQDQTLQSLNDMNKLMTKITKSVLTKTICLLAIQAMTTIAFAEPQVNNGSAVEASSAKTLFSQGKLRDKAEFRIEKLEKGLPRNFRKIVMGPGGSNGGFAIEDAKRLLNRAAQQLIGKLTNLTDIQYNPPEVIDAELTLERIQLIKQVLSRIVIKVNEQGFVDDEELMFDYSTRDPNVTTKEIYVYNAFFKIYQKPTKNDVEQVEIKLLREVSHLWGLNDPDSMAFALDVYDTTINSLGMADWANVSGFFRNVPAKDLKISPNAKVKKLAKLMDDYGGFDKLTTANMFFMIRAYNLCINVVENSSYAPEMALERCTRYVNAK